MEPINQITQTESLVPGLSAFLFGLCYEFNCEPGEITRSKFHLSLYRTTTLTFLFLPHRSISHPIFFCGLVRWDRSGWRRPGGMPCVVCREVVVGAVCATVHATDDYLRWASSHCARTPATANGDLARPPDPALTQPKPAQRMRSLVKWRMSARTTDLKWSLPSRWLHPHRRRAGSVRLPTRV